MKIGVLKEGKVPPDKRVPLAPIQCRELLDTYPDLEIVVQRSPIRAFTDAQYEALNIPMQDSVEDCDVLIGVKEVPKSELIPNKTYFYFSHTIKMQPYNRDLLLKMMDLNIRMIDYEVITNAKGRRLIGFGRYAGVVGCYNGFLAFGKKSGRYNLKPANQCADRAEMEGELSKVDLPSDFKVAITGLGRVGHGAMEILNALNLKQVSAEEFVAQSFSEPVFTQLNVTDFNEREDGAEFGRYDFYEDPSGFRSSFMKYAAVAELYIACHYWDSRSPFIFTREDIRNPKWNVQVVADISCDIDGPVASTLRPSTIDKPLFGYDPISESEVDFMDESAIGVMAVDNLPCELPKDASEDFGSEFIKKVIPHLLNNDTEGVLKRASVCQDGKLTEEFKYLSDYVAGKDLVS